MASTLPMNLNAVARIASLIGEPARTAMQGRQSARAGPQDESLRQARTCYDHLAGRLGVAIANKLADDRAVVMKAGSGWVTEHAADSLGRLGVTDADLLETSGVARRVLCRPCMDWSERRIHLAGRLGAAICDGCMDHGWLLRKSTSRALEITPRGQVALRNWMGWDLWRTVLG